MDVERFIAMEQAKLNAHLPIKRISLSEALSSPQPSVPVKNGGQHSFDKRELEALASLVSPEDRERLKLPIIIQMDRKLGRGAAKISGRLESKVVAEILGKEPADDLIIYRPEVAIIRRKFPTTTQYMFRL